MKLDVLTSAVLAISACSVVLAAPRPLELVETNKRVQSFPIHARIRSRENEFSPVARSPPKRAWSYLDFGDLWGRSSSSSSGSSSSGSSSSGSSSSGSSSSGSSSSGSSSSGSSSSGSSSSGSSSSGSSSSGSSSSGSSSSGSSSSGSSSSGSSSSGSSSSSSGSSSSGSSSSSSGSSSSGSSSSSSGSSSSSSSSSSGSSGSGGNLAEDDNRTYEIVIQLGNSGTAESVILDTGSVDLLLNSANVPTGDPSVTSQGLTCHEAYGGGGGPGGSTSDDGTIYHAPYTLAGVALDSSFCSAPIVSGRGGVLGLGFSSTNPQGVYTQTGTSPLLALQNAGITSFGIYISGDSGTFTLNGYDSQHVGGSFSTEAVTPGAGGHWTFSFTGFGANGNSGTPLTTQAFLDSGNPGINVDPQTAQSIYSWVGASSDGSIACGAGSPDIEFTFGSGTTYSIPSSIYIVKTSPTTCRVSVKPIANYGTAGATTRMAVIGNQFIKAYYSYFDIANSQLQFAPSI